MSEGDWKVVESRDGVRGRIEKGRQPTGNSGGSNVGPTSILGRGERLQHHSRGDQKRHDPSQRQQSHRYPASPSSLRSGDVYPGVVDSVSTKGRMLISIKLLNESPVLAECNYNFYYNAKLNKPFEKGDEIKVICTQQSKGSFGSRNANNNNNDEILIKVCPTRDFVRPLVILDVNGVLGEREPYDPNSRSKKRKFQPRPFADAFLDFCKDRFELALWSCTSQPGQLSLFPNLADYILFDWNQDKATNMSPRTSAVGKDKPLFFKELSKVFREMPCFDPSNTLLIDDHVEKFERNQEGTGMVIYQYRADAPHAGDDAALDPQGEVCRLLNKLVSSRLDFSKHCSELIGKSPLFESHPTPPERTKSRSDGHVEGDLKFAECFKNSLSVGTSSSKFTHDYCRKRFLETICVHKKNIESRLKDRTLPGPRTSVLKRSSIENADSYYICEKTDGVRTLIMFCKEQQLVFAINRTLDIVILYPSQNKSSHALSWFSKQNGDTILDGELVDEFIESKATKEISSKSQTLLIFDAVIVNSTKVCVKADLNIRLDAIREWMQTCKMNMITDSLPFSIKLKEFVKAKKIVTVFDHMRTPKGQSHWDYIDDETIDSITFHQSDGIVFTPRDLNYYDNLALKWKPLQMISVDFQVSTNELKEALQDAKKGKFRTESSGSCSNGSMMLKVANICLCDAKDATVLLSVWEFDQKKKYTIVECIFDKAHGFWRPLRLRTDKISPNSVNTAFSTLETVAASMDKQELIELLDGTLKLERGVNDDFDDSAFSEADRKALFESGRQPEIIHACIDSTENMNVSEHYDMIQKKRNESGNQKDDRIDMLRKVNNWAKAGMNMSILDKKYPLGPLSSQDINNEIKRLKENAKALVVPSDEIAEYLCIDFDVKYQATVVPPELYERKSPTRKGGENDRKKSSASEPVRVIDICCGRGGDLNKLTSEFTVDFYLGMDISLEELHEADERAYKLSTQKKSKKLKKFKFIHGDVGNSNCKDAIKLIGDIQPESFNMAWCQFALHYFCDKEERITNLLSIVSDLLRPGCRFCASFPNPYHVLERLKRCEQPPSVSKAICTIERGEEVKQQIDPLSSFGVEYFFSLGDAVQQCKEYVVPINRLLEIATSLGLELVTLLPMQDYIVSMTKNSEVSALRDVMGVGQDMLRPLSDEEWKAIGVYMIIAWQKKPMK